MLGVSIFIGGLTSREASLSHPILLLLPAQLEDVNSLLLRFQGWESDGPPAVLSIMAQSTSIQRIQRLIDSVPLTNLLLTLLSTSYRKVGGVTLLRIGKILYNPFEMNKVTYCDLYKLKNCGNGFEDEWNS